MYVGATQAAQSASSAQAAAAAKLNDDSNDFMLLLLTELRNQNPLDPVKDKDFMTQLTQVNSFMELQKMNATLLAATRANGLTQAASLIGKIVTYPGENGSLSAQVTGVKQDGDNVKLVLGTTEIDLAQVMSVAPAPVVTNAVAA